MMKYSALSGLSIPISNIIFGCCNPMMVNGEKESEYLLDLAFEYGFNTFDTAKVYGESERVLGSWMNNSGIRNKVVIISKGCHPDHESRLSVQALREDVESSLDRLKTDYIDIYLLHRDDEKADLESILLMLNDYIHQGIIRKIGVSNWHHKRIEKANLIAQNNGLEGFNVSSPQMSLARQVRDPWGGGCVSISWDEEAKAWYKSHPEVAVFAYSCLGHGMFSGKINTKWPFLSKRRLDRAARLGYWSRDNLKRLKQAENIAHERKLSVAQIAIAWCMSQDFPVYPIATMSSPKSILQNTKAIDVVLTKDEMVKLSSF